MANPPRVLVVDDDVSDLLVLRRLLRDTPYTVDTVRSAGQAASMLSQREYDAVVADDERLADLPGADLLAEVRRVRPQALRVLLARSERASALDGAAREGAYQVVERPFFAKPLLAALTRHAAALAVKGMAAPAEPPAQQPAAPEPSPAPPEESEDTRKRPRPAPEAPAVQATPEGRGDDTQRTKGPWFEESGDVPAPGRIAHRRILLTLAEVAEARAGYSSGHGARVSALAGVLAREAQIGGEELTSVEDAALVHDAGEIALDPVMLQQKRKLTEVERRAVEHHAESSFQIVRRAGLAPSLLQAVKHHHEHVDGTGYPDRLKGEAIPLASRIILVADTWDALATDRPYRNAVPLEGCLREFDALAGSQLDRALVALFLERRLYELIDWSDPPRPGIKLL
jgi:response regulator RpfG family c-di-GMP phosphodiesterase